MLHSASINIQMVFVKVTEKLLTTNPLLVLEGAYFITVLRLATAICPCMSIINTQSVIYSWVDD